MSHLREVYQLKLADGMSNSQLINRASDFTWEKCGKMLDKVMEGGV